MPPCFDWSLDLLLEAKQRTKWVPGRYMIYQFSWKGSLIQIFGTFGFFFEKSLSKPQEVAADQTFSCRIGNPERMDHANPDAPCREYLPTLGEKWPHSGEM